MNGCTGHDRRGLREVHAVRGREVEVDREERRATLRDHEVVSAVEPDLELGDAERVAVAVDRCRFDGIVAFLDLDVGVRIVEPDRALDEVAGGERSDAQ